MAFNDFNKLNADYQKMLSFREDESNKVKAIREIFSSKLFIAFIIAFSISVLISVSNIIASSIVSVSSWSATTVVQLIFNVALELLVPGLFFWYLLLTLLVAKEKADPKYHNSILERLFVLRRFAKIFLILMAVVYVIDGVTLFNYQNLYSSNPEIFASLNMSTEELEAYLALTTEQGRFFIYQGIVFGVMAYAFLSAFKALFKGVLFDETDNKYIEFIILISVLGLVAALTLTGDILALNGISTFLTNGTLSFNSVTGVLNFFYYLMSACFIIIGGVIIFMIRRALMNNSGSSNPLTKEVVYTIKEEDIIDVPLPQDHTEDL